MKPRPVRIALLLAGLVAIVVASLSIAEPAIVEITYVYTTDAHDLLRPLITEFNDAGIEAGGDRVRVTPLAEKGVSSGAALHQIQDEDLQPVVWTPASSLWVSQLDGAPARAPASSPTLVQSPQVVATFDAGLGDQSAHTWKGVLDLSRNEGLKLGHTDPNSSTSGLSAVLAEFSIAAGRAPGDLSEDDIDDQAVREEVRRWEASIAHYVDIADDFSKQWCQQSSLFADAAYIQETTLLRFNDECSEQLHAIYPQDVRLVADYPFVVLDANWVSPREQQAAEEFGRWLDKRLSGDGCKDVSDAKFRRAGCPLVGLPRFDGPPDEAPTGDVLAGVQQAWDELRRAANVIVVVDESQDMAPGDRLPLVRESLLDGAGARPFVDCPGPRETVGLVVFGGDGDEPAEALTAGGYDPAHKRALETEIESLAPGLGRAVLRDAVEQARQKLRGLDPETRAISTIVLLTYGVDGGSTITQRALNDALRTSKVQIIAVPYNSEKKSLDPMIQFVDKSLGRVHAFEDEEWTDVADVSKFVCQFF